MIVLILSFVSIGLLYNSYRLTKINNRLLRTISEFCVENQKLRHQYQHSCKGSEFDSLIV